MLRIMPYKSFGEEFTMTAVMQLADILHKAGCLRNDPPIYGYMGVMISFTRKKRSWKLKPGR
ncbi:MAG: hypothetical protein ACOYNL_08865 [Rickettsiales bacterium]